ncbi:hypothetical protein [Ruminococcus sp.]|uniref:hypothetical protein n=1 Tax=Ruminococcus sp. TaxID=41978 RepID=UPI001B0DDEC3|nr:hypothetical protein [Ruminococcus sp.]MBO5557672.1 hypothetical protein [Ruminococcus sp.]
MAFEMFCYCGGAFCSVKLSDFFVTASAVPVGREAGGTSAENVFDIILTFQQA